MAESLIRLPFTTLVLAQLVAFVRVAEAQKCNTRAKYLHKRIVGLRHERHLSPHGSFLPLSVEARVRTRAYQTSACSMAPQITITKVDPLEALTKFTAFNLDEFVAGKSKTWTFWNCDPSEFPWSYAKDEYAYVIAGKFSVQYEGADPVEINAGDFVHFPPGETKFNVMTPVRKFFTLV